MKRLLLTIILVCMMNPISAAGYHIKDYEKIYSEITTPIDSIVIIYHCIGASFDDLKITVSPLYGDARLVKGLLGRLHYTAKTQKLCEWQRKEIFDTLVGIYVTGSFKVGKGKMPTQSRSFSTPPEMFITIFSGVKIKKEHLIIYHVYEDDEFEYSDEFDHLHDLLLVLLLVFRDGLPIVC